MGGKKKHSLLVRALSGASKAALVCFVAYFILCLFDSKNADK